MATNPRVSGLLKQEIRKFTAKSIKNITFVDVNHLSTKRKPPKPQYVAFAIEDNIYQYHTGYERKSLLKFAEKFHPDKTLYLFSAYDFEKLFGDELYIGATGQTVHVHQKADVIARSRATKQSYLYDEEIARIAIRQPRNDSVSVGQGFNLMKIKDWLLILAGATTFFVAKEASAASFSGRVYDHRNGRSSDSMPVTLINTRTTQKDSTKVGRIGLDKEYFFSNSGWLSGDTAKVVVRDTTNNEKDSTFVLYSGGVQWEPTLCLGGWGASINKVGPNNLSFLTNDSAYAKLCTSTDTLYGKFRIRDPPYWATRYTVCFDLTNITPPPSNGTSATIKVRSDTFANSVTGTLSHGRWDADVIAESLNLVPSQGFRDVSITRTSSQTLDDTVDVGDSHQINASTKNNSDLRQENVDVIYTRKRNGVKLDSTATLQVPLEPPHFSPDTAFLGFSNWNVALQDTGLNIITYKIVPTDTVPENNTRSKTTFVRARDIGATQILEPTGQIYTNVSVTPKAIIENFGNVTTDSFKTYISIYEDASPPIYIDSIKASLTPGKKDTVEFREVSFSNPMNPGRVKAWTVWSQDINPSNDSSPEGSFDISAPPTPTPGWSRKADVPTKVPTPIPKYVKDGGALVAVATPAETALFAFRGNTRSKEFYKYYPIGDSWSSPNAMESIPFAGKVYGDTYYITPQKKYPGKGAALCFDGDSIIYGTKGNSTREFWAYNIIRNKWKTKHPAPTIKGIKGGSSLVSNRDTVYLLAGSVPKPESANFFAYVPSKDSWIVKAKLPTDPYNKTWKDGSCLTTLDGSIYALKGGDKQGYLYKYVPGTPNPIEKESIPKIDTMTALPSRILKKICTPKDGAAISAIGNKVYAEKGGGSRALWTYDITSNHWSQSVSETIPRSTDYGTKSYAKTGAGMASLDNKLWLMKGNNTPEFWQFIPSEEMSNVKGRKSKVNTNTQEKLTLKQVQEDMLLDVTPNPFTKQAVIRYTIPISGKVSLKLYNSTGRLVDVLNESYLTAGTYTTRLNTNTLAKGIYFLRYETTTDAKELKLIVE